MKKENSINIPTVEQALKGVAYRDLNPKDTYWAARITHGRFSEPEKSVYKFKLSDLALVFAEPGGDWEEVVEKDPACTNEDFDRIIWNYPNESVSHRVNRGSRACFFPVSPAGSA